MKNVLKLGLVAIAACGLLFTSCKKDDKSPTEILANGSWKLSKDESKLSTSSTWTNLTIESCTADDFTVYSTSGSYTTDEGATKCDPLDDQTTTGAWTVSSDGKTMTVDGIAFTSEISEDKVVLTLVNFLGLGEDERFTFVQK